MGPTSPGHPSVSALGFEVPEPLDMTRVSLDDEHLLAPIKNMSHHGKMMSFHQRKLMPAEEVGEGGPTEMGFGSPHCPR